MTNSIALRNDRANKTYQDSDSIHFTSRNFRVVYVYGDMESDEVEEMRIIVNVSGFTPYSFKRLKAWFSSLLIDTFTMSLYTVLTNIPGLKGDSTFNLTHLSMMYLQDITYTVENTQGQYTLIFKPLF